MAGTPGQHADGRRRQQLPSYRDLQVRVDAPPGSTWGLLGDLGTIGLLTPRQALAGAAEVSTGASFSLNYPIDAFTPPLLPTRPAATLHLTSRHPDHLDDVLDGFNPQSSSQLDGLRHRRHERYGYYNDVPAGQISESTSRLGVQDWARRGIVGRAVVVDVEPVLAARGEVADHENGPAIAVNDLELALCTQGTDLQAGDIVVLHTGWAHWYLEQLDAAGRSACRRRGRYTGLVQSRAVLEWLWDRRVPLICSDTYALEVLPPVTDSDFSSRHDGPMMHQEMLALLGQAIGELWKLDELAAACRGDGRYACLLVSAPLNVNGAVSSPANALAIR